MLQNDSHFNLKSVTTPVKNYNEADPVSPVYSLAVHRQSLWLLSGDKTGSIHLQSVRHSEGTRIHTLKSHQSAVSVLVLSPDEQSVLSGGWDKNLFDWDLNTGQIKRAYIGNSGQISAIDLRPESSVMIPRGGDEQVAESTTFSTNTLGRLSSNTTDAPLNNSADTSTVAADGALQDAPGEYDDYDSLFGDDHRTPLDGTFGLGDDEDMDPFAQAADEQIAISGLDTDVVAPLEATQESKAPTEEANGVIEASDLPEKPITGVIAPPPPSEPPATVIDKSSPRSTSSGLPAAVLTSEPQAPASSNSTFLSASIDGMIRIWDRRIAEPIAKLVTPRGTPPWCMSACWSPDGNKIYAGRRNNTVDEYSLLGSGSFQQACRTLHLPEGSKAVSAVKVFPNGRHLMCASFDILRLFDLESELIGPTGLPVHVPSTHKPHIGAVPFLIVPGHRTGMVSQLYTDPTCRFLITTGGDRGWEGRNTEVLLGYEIGCVAE
jgi:transcriptional activator SPT8